MKTKTCVMIIGLSLITMLSAIDAPARDWHGRGGNYHGYGFGYRHGGWGWSYGGLWWAWPWNFVPTVGAFVDYLPDGYTTVVVGGTPYYYYGGYYFNSYNDGYVVMPEPVPTTPPPETTPAPAPQPQSLNNAPEESKAVTAPKSSDTTTINVPNSKGGYTPVRLTKYKDGYIGPQGEFYTGHPTVAALKALYGD